MLCNTSPHRSPIDHSEKSPEHLISRRSFGGHVITLSLLTSLLGWQSRSRAESGTLTTIDATLSLPTEGDAFWDRPYDYVGCLHDDGRVTMSNNSRLIQAGSLSSGDTLLDGKVHLGLGFIEIRSTEATYLLRVLDMRQSNKAASATPDDPARPPLSVSRIAANPNAVRVSTDQSIPDAIYQIEFTPSMASPRWHGIAEVRGNGRGISVDLPTTEARQGFYRLSPQPALRFQNP